MPIPEYFCSETNRSTTYPGTNAMSVPSLGASDISLDEVDDSAY